MVPQRELGIVGSWEKGARGEDISLEKFILTGSVEVFCPIEGYMDFSFAPEMPVVLRKCERSWSGKILHFRTGYLTASPGFTPREFALENGTRPVGVYIVRLDLETPVTPEIIGSVVVLI